MCYFIANKKWNVADKKASVTCAVAGISINVCKRQTFAQNIAANADYRTVEDPCNLRH